MARFRMASLALATLALLASPATGADSDVPDDLEYARITLYKRHSTNRTQTLGHSISGVFALYAPAVSAAGVMLVSQPIDACSTIDPPDVPHGQSFILIARLDSNSRCSAVEQGLNAQRAGAVALLNMAPQRTSYIYLLEKTPSDEGLTPASIAHVAISGSSGYRFLQEVIQHHGRGDIYVTIKAASTPAPEEQMVDLVVAVSCMAIAVLVLCYAYRVGRNLCLAPPPDFNLESAEPSVEKLEENKQKMAKLLDGGRIRIVPYKADENVEDCCAICLDQLRDGDSIRELWCNHFFHVDCIDPWLLNKQSCPLCKDEVLARAEADPSCDCDGDSNDGSFKTDNSRHCPAGAVLLPLSQPSNSLMQQLSNNVAEELGQAGALRSQATIGTSARRLSLTRSTGNGHEGGAIYLPKVRAESKLDLPCRISDSSMSEILELLQIENPGQGEIPAPALSDVGPITETSSANFELRVRDMMSDPGPSDTNSQSGVGLTHTHSGSTMHSATSIV